MKGRLIRDGLVADEQRLRTEAQTDVKRLLGAEEPVVVQHHADRRATRAPGAARIVAGGQTRHTDAPAKGEPLKGASLGVVPDREVPREIIEIAIDVTSGLQ